MLEEKVSRKEENDPIHTIVQMSYEFKVHLLKYSTITTPSWFVQYHKNKCGYCGKEFTIGPLAIAQFDFVINIKERWQIFESK